MSSVLVTGGSGFIGGALIRRLVADGREVRALARTDGAADLVGALGANPVPGHLLDVDSLESAASGVDTVFHVAGVNEMCPRRELEMFQANVTGTRNVVAAAATAGAGRVVYTSSAVVLGEQAGTIGSEHSAHRGRYLSTYERSKHEAELVAFTAAGHHGIDVVAVNPSSVQGPGRVGGSARIFLYALRSHRPWLFDTALSIVDIDDCIDAHLAAERHGAPGARYVVSGTTIGVRDAVATLNEVAGTTTQPRMIPRALVRMLGMPLSYITRYVPTKVGVCPDLIRVLLHGHAYDGSNATRELGIRYTPFEETLRKSVEWYRAEGLID